MSSLGQIIDFSSLKIKGNDPCQSKVLEGIRIQNISMLYILVDTCPLVGGSPDPNKFLRKILQCPDHPSNIATDCNFISSYEVYLDSKIGRAHV